MALVIMRISMPDRLGILAAVTSAVSDANADIVTIEVVDRSDGFVVDNLCVEIGAANPSELRRRVEHVDGVVVELVRSVNVPPSRVDALELASSLADNDDLRVQILVDGLPRALGAEWAMALALQDDAVELVHASSGAPSPPEGTVPWMPLEAPRRLSAAPWMPTSWRFRSLEHVGELEIAACPLGSPTKAVAMARTNGRFWPPELRQLEILAQLAIRDPHVHTPPPVPSEVA